MSNSNHALLKTFYDNLAKGDLAGMLSVCSDDVTFEVKGKSLLAGKYNKTTVGPQLLGKLSELSQGTYKLEVHDIMASDLHGMILTTNSLTRNGAKLEYRAVHVWRIQQGKLVAWYQYFRDQYQHDTVWG